MENQNALELVEEGQIHNRRIPARSATRSGLNTRSAGQESYREDENALIRSIGDGDERAFEKLFHLYSKKTFQMAYRLLGNQHEAEEAVQEVFLTIFQKAKTFRGDSQFSTWLYRLAVNAALSRIRKQKRRKEISYGDFLPQFQPDGHHQVRPVIDWSPEIEEGSPNQELQRALRSALTALKPVDKAIIVLSDIEGFSDQEIAQSLSLTVSAVKTRLHRARLFLRGKLAVHLGYSAA
ncbi:MAG: RNA polymerase sigma factor [Candidatus Binatia bacterium]